MVSFLGMGINPLSKFFFAVLVIMIFVVMGYRASGNPFGGVFPGLMLMSIFLYIEYIPKWLMILIAVVLAIKWGFR